jgi:GMP synthase (glutamine-hydrolysing)
MSRTRPLAILKTGRKIDTLRSIPGDYEDWIAAGMGWETDRLLVIDAAAGDPLPAPGEISGIAITGSGAMVTDQVPWMLDAAAWLAEAVREEIPVLGICFGHQLLGHALGGRVDFNPRGVEVGTVEVTLTGPAADDPLFRALPPGFPAQVSHRQSVLALPPGATLLGSSAMEPHQAFAIGPRAWGVQFHPEFDERIIGHFVDYYREILERQGRSVQTLHEAVRPAPQSQLLLERFAGIVRGRN